MSCSDRMTIDLRKADGRWVWYLYGDQPAFPMANSKTTHTSLANAIHNVMEVALADFALNPPMIKE